MHVREISVSVIFYMHLRETSVLVIFYMHDRETGLSEVFICMFVNYSSNQTLVILTEQIVSKCL